jgi:hypothetical protein
MSAAIQTDPVSRLYLAAEGMRHLAATLPEEDGGLARLMDMLGREVRSCAEQLDDEVPPEKAVDNVLGNGYL